jgi:hypothetical protein
MDHSQSRLEIAIYRGEVADQQKFQGVDFGPLLNELVTTPKVFAGDKEQGAITLDLRRTHEWEFLVGIAVAGSAAFLKGALTELGKQLGSWLAGQLKKLDSPGPSEVRGGEFVVRVDAADLGRDAANVVGLLELLEESARRGFRVQVIIKPAQQTKTAEPGDAADGGA